MVSADRHLYLDANSLSRHSHWAHGFMRVYADWLGLTLLALIVVAGWLWSRRRPDAVGGVVACVLAGLSAVISLGINHFVSQAVARARPCRALAAHHHLALLIPCAHDYSFPSDHAVIAGGIAMGLVFFSRRLAAAAWLLALFLAFARVYAGVHYPADVIAGLLLGSAVAIVVWLVLRRPALAVAGWVVRTPLGSLIAAGAPLRT
jgi:undecaprenyl-diphosphatase